MTRKELAEQAADWVMWEFGWQPKGSEENDKKIAKIAAYLYRFLTAQADGCSKKYVDIEAPKSKRALKWSISTYADIRDADPAEVGK